MNDGPANGPLHLWRKVGGLTLATVRNRVELFAVECEEEKCRLIQALLLTAAAITVGAAALVLVTITIVLLFWENGRLAALGGLSAVFVLATAFLLRELKKLKASGPGFRGTVDELKKDCACLLPPD